jgi:hypothetical protein
VAGLAPDLGVELLTLGVSDLPLKDLLISAGSKKEKTALDADIAAMWLVLCSLDDDIVYCNCQG